jgi:hypothetical protein
MKQELAILSVLSPSPRPLSAQTIAALAGQFKPLPSLPTDPSKAEARVTALCELLAEQGDVFFQASRNRGSLWSITTTGQARLRE